ncbi:MAG TPA: hypothetical protein VG496_12435 [Myxococcales bacterium]|nr:hypothetical protein [Myxococcales bacterium]
MPDGVERSRHSTPIRPILVSVAACGAFVAFSSIAVPGVRPTVIDPAAIRVGFLGLNPILAGFILTELVAVLVPSLRALRTTIEGRIRLRQTSFLVGLAVAAVQIQGILRYSDAIELMDRGSVFHPPTIDPRLILATMLLIGVVAAMTLAWLIDVAGIGVGYSLLLAAMVASNVPQLVSKMSEREDDPRVPCIVVAAFAFGSYRMLRKPPIAGKNARYRLPTAGVEPVHKAILLVPLLLGSALARSFFWPLLPGAIDRNWISLALQLLLTIALSKLLSNIFHRPTTEEDSVALRKATRASTTWLCALVLGAAYINQVAAIPVVFDWLALIGLIAVGMDVAIEIRAHMRHGSMRVLRVVHTLEDSDSLCAELGAAGIPTALRGAHHRALFHFFAPFIPVSVLVPATDAERAEFVALEYSQARSAPPPLPVAPHEGKLAPG